MRDLKYITINGPATHYKAVIFRFGDAELEKKSGFRGEHYVGMILLDPWMWRVLQDDVEGYAPWALRQAGLDAGCPVLLKGWGTVMRCFDEIPDGGNVEVSESGEVTIEDKWLF